MLFQTALCCEAEALHCTSLLMVFETFSFFPFFPLSMCFHCHLSVCVIVEGWICLLLWLKTNPIETPGFQ